MSAEKEEDAPDDGGQSETPVFRQVVNHQPTFFNFNISGNSNNVFSHVEKLVINNGGGQDEQ